MSGAPREGSVTYPVRVGEVLRAKYRVDGILGRGGMGTVAVATNLRLGTRVALKLLNVSSKDDPDAAARFAREARVAARIASEHVVRILDVDETEQGEPMFVMEYLDGTDLDTLLDREGRLEIGRAVDYVLQACEALAEAHARGIVHRDLKPANLFLAEKADGTRVVKLLDFGISKLVAAEDLALTDTGVVVGSPFFMSPEQLLSAKHVDRRTDVWSLGVTLYLLLSGELPFDAETSSSVAARIAAASPVPLSAVLAGVPPELERAVMRCIAKKPDERFSDIADLARAIEPFAAPGSLGGAERVARAALRGATSGRDARPPGAASAPPPPPPTQVPSGARGPSAASEGRWTLEAEAPEPEPAPMKDVAAPPRATPAPARPERGGQTDHTTSRDQSSLRPAPRGRARVAAVAVACASVVTFGAWALWPGRGPREEVRGAAAEASAQARSPDGPAPSATEAPARPSSEVDPPPASSTAAAASARPAPARVPRGPGRGAKNPADIELK